MGLSLGIHSGTDADASALLPDRGTLFCATLGHEGVFAVAPQTNEGANVAEAYHIQTVRRAQTQTIGITMDRDRTRGSSSNGYQRIILGSLRRTYQLHHGSSPRLTTWSHVS